MRRLAEFHGLFAELIVLHSWMRCDPHTGELLKSILDYLAELVTFEWVEDLYVEFPRRPYSDYASPRGNMW